MEMFVTRARLLLHRLLVLHRFVSKAWSYHRSLKLSLNSSCMITTRYDVSPPSSEYSVDFVIGFIPGRRGWIEGRGEVEGTYNEPS